MWLDGGGANWAGPGAGGAERAALWGVRPGVAYVGGDDLLGRLDGLLAGGVGLANLDTGQQLADAGAEPVTANAYLGGWPITEALAAGADVVICPRVTDAALTSGPAAWWHGWSRTDWDRLAGAVIAGHVIECGPQACGGNYPFLEEITDRRYPGFPIAEVAADGSTIITKHNGTGGLVSAGTVTAQLLYEIAGPDYAGPDVVAHFDSVRLTGQGPDRVLISGAKGSPPPATLKVALNYLGGYRNTMTLVLTGLDIEEKAAWARQELFGLLGGEDRFEAGDGRLLRFVKPDAPTNEQATAPLGVACGASAAGRVGGGFSAAVRGRARGGYAVFHPPPPPTPATAYGVYWPALVPADVVEQAVVLPGGEHRVVPHTAASAGASAATHARAQPEPGAVRKAGRAGAGGARAGAGEGGEGAGGTGAAASASATVRGPLGLIAGARSGDKGGNANVGLWARDPAAFAWLREELTVARFRSLLPEAAELEIQRYELPNLAALNFVIVGLLGRGVAASARPDPQAKGLGEYLRSRLVDVPAVLLGSSSQPSPPGVGSGQR